MQEEPTRDVGKPFPQQGGQEHQIVIMHEHNISLLVDACHRLQEKLVGVSICLEGPGARRPNHRFFSRKGVAVLNPGRAILCQKEMSATFWDKTQLPV